jgi:hypothetical protein
VPPQHRYQPGSWARLKPSGYLHYLVREAGGPGDRRRKLACQRKPVRLLELTDEFPEGTTHCPVCTVVVANTTGEVVTSAGTA